MKHIAVAGLLVAGCAVDSRPSAPDVRLIADGPDQYAGGLFTWHPLGFDRTLEGGLLECARDWYVTGDAECVITINVVRDPLLQERDGTNALSNRADRLVVIDSDLTNPYDLSVAVAHELGHILLDTPRHTQGGVMGGASNQLEQVDYELACETVRICL